MHLFERILKILYRSSYHLFSFIRGLLPWLGLGILLTMLALLMREWPLPSSRPEIQRRIISGQFMTVVIDPGHGGVDDGASAHGLKEKTITLDIAQRLAAALNRQGLTALLTRKADEYISLSARVALAEAVPNAIFISLHCNFSDSSDSRGLEIYRCAAKGENGLIRISSSTETVATAEQQLAENLDEAVTSRLHIQSRGEKDANFFVIRNVDYPAILVECGFITNPEEAKSLQDSAYRENLAEALAFGIGEYHSSIMSNRVKPKMGGTATTAVLSSK